MRKGRSRGIEISARQVPVLLIALALGWTALANGAVRLFAKSSPARAGLFWPSHPLVDRARALEDIAADVRTTGSSTPASLKRVTDLRFSEPLSNTPFLALSLDAQRRGDLDQALKASGIALARDPGDGVALGIDIQNSALGGKYSRLFEDIVLLGQTQSAIVRQHGKILATLVDEPEMRSSLRAAMTRSPVLTDAVLSALSTSAGNYEKIMSLAPKAGPSSLHNPEAHWPSQLMQTLLAAGEARKARNLWLSKQELNVDDAPLLYDGQFRDTRSQTVFSWQLTADANGLADPRKGGGIDLISYGRADTVLARQALAMPAGRYRVTANVLARSGDFKYRMVMTCPGANAHRAGAMEIPPGRTGRLSFDATVDGNCPWQDFTIAAESPDLPGQGLLSLQSVEIARSGS